MYANNIDVAGRLLKLFLVYLSNEQTSTFTLQLNTITNVHPIDTVLLQQGFVSLEGGETNLMVKCEQQETFLSHLQALQVVALSPLEYPNELVMSSKF